jgi:hypothetical protein
VHAGGLAPPLLLHASALATAQEAEWRAKVRRLAPAVAGYVQQYTSADPLSGALRRVLLFGQNVHGGGSRGWMQPLRCQLSAPRWAGPGDAGLRRCC